MSYHISYKLKNFVSSIFLFSTSLKGIFHNMSGIGNRIQQVLGRLSPGWITAIFTVVNILNYLDRGIVPVSLIVLTYQMFALRPYRHYGPFVFPATTSDSPHNFLF